MKVTEVTNEGLRREYKIIVPAEEITKRYDSELDEISKTMKAPGFRPGKVPKHIAEKQYHDKILSQVLQNTLDKTTTDLIKEKEFDLAIEPKIEVESFKEKEDLIYKLFIELFPKFDIPDFSDIKLEKIVPEIGEEDIDESAKEVAKNSKNYVSAKDSKKSEQGDAVLIDYEGKLDDVPFEGGKGEKYQLALGSNTFIPGFEDQLVGMKKGQETQVKVTFPDEYHSPNLAGKDAVFDVKIHDVLIAEEAKIDDEFAKKFGLKDLNELRGSIRTKLDNDAASIVKTKLRKELFDKLESKCDFLCPESLLENEFKNLWDSYLKEKSQNPNSLAKSEAEAKEEYQKLAERRVKLGILISSIGKAENINIDQNDIREAVYQQARQFAGQEHLVIDYYRNNPKALELLKGPILEDKVVDSILTKIQVEEQKMPLKKLFELAKNNEI
ncbi:MAG: trigger factor [Alphaproteobacteria bacterium]